MRYQFGNMSYCFQDKILMLAIPTEGLDQISKDLSNNAGSENYLV